MSNEVYANGMEIACKAGAGKSICAFPDVCLTPPAPPAGPLPIPYPNTGMASDTDGGSKTVKVSGKEVMLKDKSSFKKSTGDEAATKSQGASVITHQIQGKCYFKAWSSDVKIEGENAVRHLDIMTHNHASDPGGTPPWPFADAAALKPGGDCAKENAAIKKHCNPEKDWKKNCPTPPAHPGPKPKARSQHAKYKADYKKYISEFPGFAKKCKDNKCINARKCMMSPYVPSQCCDGQTGDHLIDAASFLKPGGPKDRNQRNRIDGWSKYDVNAAPCVCAEGPNQTTATHGQLHTRRGVAAVHHRDSKGMWSRSKATDVGAKAVSKTFPSAGCSEKCTKSQLDNYHDKAKDPGKEKPIKANASMTSDEGARAAARIEMGVPNPGKGSTR